MSATRTASIALFFGLLAVSSAAILIRFAQEENIPSLVIALGRLGVATAVLTPLVVGRYLHELRQLARQDIGLCLLSGVFLGMHFAAWITSLEYTSVVASVVLVTTNPLFVALLSLPLLGERVQRPVIVGIVIAFAGSVMVAASDDAGEAPTRSAPLLGNGLAILGAVAVAVYLIIGRRVRANLSLIPYIWLVYGTAALVLLPAVFAAGQSLTGYAAAGYLSIAALGLFPQLIGHSAFNYALGHFPAAYVSLMVLAEPIGSAILAILFLGEMPTLAVFLGSLVILAGVAYANFNRWG
ncbi:MAG: DMT family transporter [Anaerolineae bacterium]|nr:DMT family transporter [Anaerolineae bacterium]